MVKAVSSEVHGCSSGREFLPCHLNPNDARRRPPLEPFLSQLSPDIICIPYRVSRNVWHISVTLRCIVRSIRLRNGRDMNHVDVTTNTHNSPRNYHFQFGRRFVCLLKYVLISSSHPRLRSGFFHSGYEVNKRPPLSCWSSYNCTNNKDNFLDRHNERYRNSHQIIKLGVSGLRGSLYGANDEPLHSTNRNKNLDTSHPVKISAFWSRSRRSQTNAESHHHSQNLIICVMIWKVKQTCTKIMAQYTWT